MGALRGGLGIVGAALAVLVLWWLKSIPYHRSAEETLQEALDSQSVGVPTAAPVALRT